MLTNATLSLLVRLKRPSCISDINNCVPFMCVLLADYKGIGIGIGKKASRDAHAENRSADTP
jgi:hypothetical protein